jgi:SnoaL-like domain
VTDTAAPPLIRRYFELAPQPDSDAYYALFADDATVEDEGAEHHGIDGIRAWRANVPLVTYTVHGVHASNGGFDAAVDIAGDFAGSPVRLTFHFEHDSSQRITLLTIRP